MTGTIRINSATDKSISTLDDLADTSRLTAETANQIHTEIYGENGVYSTLSNGLMHVQSYTEKIINEYKADVGQYMAYDENGLTLGATSSEFKTVIDNQGMYFKQGDTTVSYVNNNQLNIPNAVINHSLIISKYFFSTRDDGGFSISWQGD